MSGDSHRALRITSARGHGRRLLLRFDEVDTLDGARSLAGGHLAVTEAPPAPNDFFYSHEISGWTCEDGSGRRIGIATGVAETPAGPMLTLDAPGRKDVLVPFVRPIVVRMDRDGKRIVLDLPEGLLDL